MSDIFISYSRQDRPRVEILAGALEQAGWSVWWDRHIRGGDSFDKLIEGELQKARVVLVAWSRDSVNSDWVRAEAAYGQERSKLLPVKLDDCLPPLRFTHVQTQDISRWDGGSSSAAALRDLIADIRALLGQGTGSVAGAAGAAGAAPDSGASSPTSAARKRLPAAAVWAAVALGLVVVGAGAWRMGWFGGQPGVDQSGAHQPATVPAANPELEVLDQDMYATRDAPMRARADVTAPQVAMLAAGGKVHVAGRVRGSDWYAVQRDGADLAYVAMAALSATRAATAPATSTPVAAVAPVAVKPPEPAKAAIAYPYDGRWTGTLRCAATRNLPAVSGGTRQILIQEGKITLTAAGSGADPDTDVELRGEVSAAGQVSVNGVIAGRQGRAAVAFSGSIDGRNLRATGMIRNRSCLLAYTRL